MKNALLLIIALLGAPLFSFAQNPSGSDIATVRDRYIDSVLPATQEARENAKTLAAKFAVSLKTDGSWDDVDYTGTDRAVWTTCDHLERVAVMARAARMKKDSGQVDEALVAKTLLALHYWNEKDFKNSNWWWNEIHVPQLMGEIGNLLRAEIPAADLAKMIEIMSQVERDLKAGRYQNALRQRHVLAEGLGNVKQYLEGELEVRQDATANLPADIQKKILGSMHDPSPSGWEDLNRRYFERLTTGGEEKR